ncbi:unnamed protein product [Arctogadus glacialis]
MEDFGVQEVRSSGDLWSDICSTLPEVKDEVANQEENTLFTDSFKPASPVNGESNGRTTNWQPMDDSEIYIASLENRLKRLKGLSSDVTSRDMLKSLSQAKKECWDRFLHDTQTSEIFQSGDLDEGAMEHLKRWLIPEKVAISAEELEYLLRPSVTREDAAAAPDRTQSGDGEEGDRERPGLEEEEDPHQPEK